MMADRLRAALLAALVLAAVPASAVEDLSATNFVRVGRKVASDPVAAGQPVVSFYCLLGITASTNSYNDDFELLVYNQADKVLGGLTFDLGDGYAGGIEEALSRVERFLDDLLLSDERQVRIIHGFGTGQMRRSIGEYLDRHPLVATHQSAPQEHGGGGFTVAELKD